MKYLGINLVSPQTVYGNHKTLLKESTEGTNKWKGIPCPWMVRLNIVKMTVLPKEIHRVNVIPIKFLFLRF